MVENKEPTAALDQAPKADADLPLPEPVIADPPQSVEVKKDVSTNCSHWQRFRGWYTSHKKLSIPFSILVLLLLLLALPFTRYSLAGLVLKKNFVVQVNDSTTNTPVSGANVSSGGVSAQTDGNGKAKIKLSVGHHKLSIAKKYYKDQSATVLVPLLSEKKVPTVAAEATGRQVKVSIKNTISKKSVENVDIKVLDITAKTDKDGNALIVLPAGMSSHKVTLSLSGYNNTDVNIKVSDSKVEENDFTITPTGRVYFLSKLSGKVDVVKANLDGSDRQIVLAGTGKEDNYGTVLLASRDWKYLALLSRRDSSLAKLYLIETGSDTVTAVDEGNADFSLIGWSDDNFVYQVNRIGYQTWQPKQYALKSYDAVAKKINLLDESAASGSDYQDAAAESYDATYLIGQKLVYSKSWSSNNDYLSPPALTDKQAGIYSINTNGSGKQTHKNFGFQVGTNTYINSLLYKPNEIYYQVNEKGGDPKYFEYSNGQLVEKASIKDGFETYQNSGDYKTYLASPSGDSTFWSEPRDGKNTLFVGDSTGDNSKQAAVLSDFQTYGWYSDNYLLASKNGSELYIFGVEGIKKDGDALKVTDYHKPNVSYPGYGGGYGGL